MKPAIRSEARVKRLLAMSDWSPAKVGIEVGSVCVLSPKVNRSP